MENFRPVCSKPVIDDTGVEHVILTSMGDMVGFPKGAIMNFVVRKNQENRCLPTPFQDRWLSRRVLADGAG